MKQVLVTGGTGNLGKWVIDYLLQNQYNVSLFTTRSNLQLQNITVYTGDLARNEGIIPATEQADMIIHCASQPQHFEQADIEGTRNLLHSINSKKTQHLVYISIVGVDKSDYPYYRAKYAVEQMIVDSGIPYTILRTTQFHSFVLNIIQSLVNNQQDDVILIPAGMKFQSVDIREVAKQLVDCLEKAAGLLPCFGGPQVLTFEDMFQDYLTIIQTKATVKLAAIEGVRYTLFCSGVNLCPNHAYGKITWQQFLQKCFQ